MKCIEVKKGMFDKLAFKIEVSPLGKKKCDCGYIDCVDLDCLMYEIRAEEIKKELKSS